MSLKTMVVSQNFFFHLLYYLTYLTPILFYMYGTLPLKKHKLIFRQREYIYVTNCTIIMSNNIKKSH